jgi:hypothetical protein
VIGEGDAAPQKNTVILYRVLDGIGVCAPFAKTSSESFGVDYLNILRV